MRRLPVIWVFARNPVARSRRNRGCTPATKSMAWSTRSHAGSTATSAMKQASLHERRAFAKRFASQHCQLPFVAGQPQDGAQSGGLTGAIGTDESDDAACLDR